MKRRRELSIRSIALRSSPEFWIPELQKARKKRTIGPSACHFLASLFRFEAPHHLKQCPLISLAAIVVRDER